MGNTGNTPLKIGSTLQAQKVARCLPVFLVPGENDKTTDPVRFRFGDV